MKKKITLLLFLTISFSCISYGQDQDAGKFGKLYFGVHTGLNTSYMSKGFFNLTGVKTGFNEGLYVGYFVTPEISASFEPMYSQTGASNISFNTLYYPAIEGYFLSGIKQMDLQIHTINLPVIATYYLKGGNLTPKFFGGASLDYTGWAYTINERSVLNQATNQISTIKTYSAVDNRIQTLGASAIIGGGVNMKISQFVLSVDLRGTIGFNNMNGTSNKTLPLYSRSFALVVGVGL